MSSHLVWSITCCVLVFACASSSTLAQAADTQRSSLPGYKSPTRSIDDVTEISPSASSRTSAPASPFTSTFVPGLVGLTIGAAFPLMFMSLGALYLASSGDMDGPEGGFIAFAFLGAGLVTIGPATTLGSAVGMSLGAAFGHRRLQPVAAGVVAGGIALGIAVASFPVLINGLPPDAAWLALVVPTVLVVISGPLALTVATVFDMATFDDDTPTESALE